MTTLNLTPEQKAIVEYALWYHVDYLKGEYKSADDFKSGRAMREAYEAALEVLEIFSPEGVIHMH